MNFGRSKCFFNVMKSKTVTSWTYFRPEFEYLAELPKTPLERNDYTFFAYDLVRNLKPRLLVDLGTHYGISFFSFCQAVKDSNLECGCYAMDTWIGDHMKGLYSDDIYQWVSQTAARLYKNVDVHFIRQSFHEASSRFEDGSVDILNIHELRNYVDLRGDFDAWIPKMSDEGVILVHAIQSRLGDFGVHPFWASLKEAYPHFEFGYAHGLGVAFPNKKPEVFRQCETAIDSWSVYYPSMSERHAFQQEIVSYKKDRGLLETSLQTSEADKNALIQKLERTEHDIQSMQNTIAWKVYTKIKKIIALLCPEDSKRERFYRGVISAIRSILFRRKESQSQGLFPDSRIVKNGKNQKSQTGHLNIAIVGLAKSGTTALFYRIKKSLPRNYRCFF